MVAANYHLRPRSKIFFCINHQVLRTEYLAVDGLSGLQLGRHYLYIGTFWL